MVLEVLSSLLRAREAEQTQFHIQNLPLGLYKTHKPQMRWIYDFRAKHGYYPSVLTFQARWPDTPVLKTRKRLAGVVAAFIDLALFDTLRNIVKKGDELHQGGQSIDKVVNFFRQEMLNFPTYDPSYVDMDFVKAETVRDYKDGVKQIAAGKRSNPSPWPVFNEAVGYIEPGELSILAARTGMGKSWVTLFWADYLLRRGERVLFISKEMPARQVIRRFEALHFRLPHTLFRKFRLPPQILRRWKRQRAEFQKELAGSFVVAGQDNIKGSGFSHIMQKIKEYKPTTVFVDGAYLIMPEEKTNGERERFALISSSLKRLALNTNTKMFGIIQSNRSAEAEDALGPTRSTLANLYGADTWGQDADNVILINGRRGAPVRTMLLDKGREAPTTEWSIKFKVDPPFFGEVVGSQTQNNVKFTGI